MWEGRHFAFKTSEECEKGAARGRERSEASYAGMERDGSQRAEEHAARSDVAWMAASGAKSAKAEVGLSEVSRVDVDWEDRNFVRIAGASQKKWKSSDKQRTCGDAHGGGRRPELGGVGIRPKKGGPTSAGQVHVRQEVHWRGLQVCTSLQLSWRKRVACRTRSTSAGTAMIAG